MKQTIISIIAIVFIGVFLSGCGSSKSSHHASLSVFLEPNGVNGGDAMKLRKNETEKYLPDLITVLKETGLKPVTDASTPLNTVSFGNRQSDKTLRFKGQATGQDNTIPLEALIVIDTKEYETIRITLSEAYSVEPSDRLTKLYSKLDQVLESLDGQKQSSLW